MAQGARAVVVTIDKDLCQLVDGQVSVFDFARDRRYGPDEVVEVSAAIKTFPGRIQRDEWVSQAQDLIRRFPDPADRPTREKLPHRRR